MSDDNDPLVPIFSPDGKLGDIPASRLHEAVQHGGKPGVHMTAPDGTKGVIPADRVQDAVKNGGKVEPFEQQPAKSWFDIAKSAGSTLWNNIKNIPNALAAPDPLADPRVSDEEKNKIVAQQEASAQAKNAQRTKEHGALYSVGATANEMIGVPVEGEEQAAKEGDVGAVLGHAATVPAIAAASAGAGLLLENTPEAVMKVVEKAKSVTPKQAAQTVGAASGAAAGHGGLSAPGAYYGAKTMGRVAESVLGKERANAPIFPAKPQPAPLPAVPPAEVLQAAPGLGGGGGHPAPAAPADALGRIPVAPQPPAPFNAGGPLPETPTEELLKSHGLAEGGKAPPEPPAAALGKVPVAKQPPAPARPAPPLPEAFQGPGKTYEPPVGTANKPFKLSDADPRAVFQAVNELGADADLDKVAKRAQQIQGSYPPEAPDLKAQKSTPTKADTTETANIQEQVRNAAEREDRMRLREVYGEQRVRNEASTPKSVLTGVRSADEGTDLSINDRKAPSAPKPIKDIANPEQARRQLQRLKQAGASPKAIQEFVNLADGKFGAGKWQNPGDESLEEEWRHNLEYLTRGVKK